MLFVVFFCCSGAVSTSLAFSNVVVLTEEQGEYSLGLHLKLLEDPSGSLSFEQVRSADYVDRFLPSTSLVPSFGFSQSVYWARVDIDRQIMREQVWMLEFAYSPMQWIDVYTLSEDGQIHHQRGGGGVRFSERPYAHYKHIFELAIPPGQVTQLYVRVDGESSISIPLKLYRSDIFAQNSGQSTAMLSIYVGIMIALFCYNLFVYSSIREAAYLYYVVFLAVFLLFMLSVHGISQIFLVPESPSLGLRMIPLSIGVSGVFGVLFTMSFLNSRDTLPRCHWLLRGIFLWSVIACLLPWLVSYRISILTGTALALVFSGGVSAVAIIAVARGKLAARYYLLAWCLLLLGIFLFAARAMGLLPANPLTEYAMLWGSAAEAILLSVALAARMRVLKEEKEHAQQDALRSKETALQTISDYNARLELEVKARTRELIDAQQQLVMKQKLAALGVLTAGVAHEINNPNNFIQVGLQNVADWRKKFGEFINELLSDEADPEITALFDARLSVLDEQLGVIETGSSRINAIVVGLRQITRLDEADQKEVDVIDGLEQTVRLMTTKFSSHIEFETRFNARQVMLCWPAELNQVFMSVLLNACQAIEARQAGSEASEHGQILVESSQRDGQLDILFKDNGCGMAPDVLEKALDPFFTTKPVGAGAGLGLSISREIIAKHGGSLALDSVIGQGSWVRISLPIEIPQVSSAA